MDQKRVTVKVDPALHRAARVKAAQEGKTISEIMRDLLQAWLAKEGEPKPAHPVT